MEEVEASMKRSFGYDPGVTWQILDIKESSIPGLAEVLVSINKQQPVHLFLAPGAQTAIAGQMIPFGPDPFAACARQSERRIWPQPWRSKSANRHY